MRASLRTAAASILAGLAALAVMLWLGQASNARLRILVDLDVGGGATVRVYVNEAAEPLVTPAVVGRHVYEFADVAGPITRLRLDPVDASDVVVRLHGLEVVAPDGRTIATFGPQTIRQWIIRGVDIVAVTPDALVMRSTNAYPFLIGFVETIAAGATEDVRTALSTRLRREPWLSCILVLPLLSLVQVRPFKAWLLRTLLMIAVVAAWPSIYVAVWSLDWGPTTSVVALSRAAYQGVSLPAIQIGVAAAFLAAAAAGSLAGLVRAPSIGPVERREVPGVPFVVAAAAALVLLTAPDLSGMAGWFATMQYTPHWDYDNVLYWSYWSAHGALPFRDFWYPYGGFFLFDLPWPNGPLAAWCAAAVRYVVFAFALVLASPGRRWSAAVATAALMLAESSGLNLAAPRYLLGINVVLAFVAARRAEFRGWLPLSTLGAALISTLVFEPAQLAYAGPALVVVALLDLIKRRDVAGLRRGAAFAGVVVLAASVLLSGLLWSYGMLGGVVDVHRRLGDLVQYSALPAVFVPSPWPDFPPGNVVVWLPAVMLVVGLAEYRRADAQAYVRASALVGLAVLASMALQKHLVRPIPETMVLYPLVAGLAFGVLSPRGRWPIDRIGVAAASGLLVGVLILHGRTESVRASASRLPSQVIGTLGVLASRDALGDANRVRYAPERFALFHQQRELVDQLQARHGGPVRVFTLTDDPVVYLFTGQSPVWHINLYNGSPTYEQHGIIGGLRETAPDYVLALRSRLSFDAVPIAVRVPEIVEYVVTHFVADAPADPYVVLRPRRAGEAISLPFWRDVFGDTLDLGMLPALLADDERESCASSTACDEVLILVRTGRAAEPTASVAVTAGDVTVNLMVQLTPDRQRYVIPLSRLWPFVAAREAELPVDATAPAGFTLDRVRLSRPAGRLY